MNVRNIKMVPNLSCKDWGFLVSKELCSKFTLCTWIITTVITFIKKSCNYLSFIRFIEGQICVTKLRCILYMYHNNFALGAKKHRYNKLTGFLQRFFEEVECWSVLDTRRIYRLKASYPRLTLLLNMEHWNSFNSAHTFKSSYYSIVNGGQR